MLDHFTPGITLTITTCQRLNHFHETIKAFFKHCQDSDEICRVIVSDDRSSETDRLDMLAKYPDFEFVWQSCGHPASLKSLFQMVTTEFFFHLEDDWSMLRDLNLLTASIQVMNEAKIDSFTSGLNIGYRTNKIREIARIKYYIHEHIPDGRFYSEYGIGNSSWPGFRLAPSMHRTRSVQSVPYEAVHQHERRYAKRYQAAGYKVAFNCGKRIFKHEAETSAYDITKSPR